jgi:uncharacterized coiled-coil DUF342 family protein
LNDKKTFLVYKVSEYREEKEKLKKALDELTESKLSVLEKYENEIKGYKNMTESCLKTCSELSEEIIRLRKEIDKYNFNSNSTSSTGYSVNQKHKKR